ncbi:MAG: class I SAM-dependent methyltransferase [Planctomycetota bacterium]
MLHLTESYAKECYNKAFRHGLEEYQKVANEQALKYITKTTDIKVLDIGCGAGQWAMAIAQMHHSINVIALDINQYALDLARAYADKHNIHNIKFIRMSHDELPIHFKSSSFDVVLCNSVLPYINETEAFRIMSMLLKTNGIILSMWNHHIGYYFRRLIKGISHLKTGDIVFSLNIILRNSLREYIFKSSTNEHIIYYNQVKRTAQCYGLRIERIPFIPLMDYQREYLRLPYVWNFRGIKIND